MATVSKKCPQCQTWNGEVDYCSNCGYLFSYKIQREQEEEARQKKQKDERNQYEVILDRFKAKPGFFNQLLYHVMNSIYLVIFLITSFIVGLITFING